MTEKKEPIKLCSQCRLSDPTREQSTAIPWETSRATMIVLLIAYWRINSEVVSLTVLKCNILSYSSNVIRRLPKKLLSRRNMKKKYMISCGSTSWVGGIPWQWKYGRHCAIDIFAFFFDSRSLVIFLCSPLAPFSAHLNAWNRSVLTMKILHWVTEGD